MRYKDRPQSELDELDKLLKRKPVYSVSPWPLAIALCVGLLMVIEFVVIAVSGGMR